MDALVIKENPICGYRVLTLDRDLEGHPIASIIIDGISYDPVHFHYNGVDPRMYLHTIAIRADASFLDKQVTIIYK